MTLRRKAPIRRSSTLSRSSGIAKKNAKRRESEFARCYGSKERVAWVKRQRCANCQLRASDHSGWIEVVNAHIENGGEGRKADYDKIIPLCETIYRNGCHDRQHGVNGGWSKLHRLDTVAKREAAAAATEAKWQLFRASRRTTET